VFATGQSLNTNPFGCPAGLIDQSMEEVVRLAGTEGRTLEMITEQLLPVRPVVICSTKNDCVICIIHRLSEPVKTLI
jgi:hypothetical protein